MAKAKPLATTPDEHSLNTTGQQGAAGAPPQDEPTAEQQTANAVARQLGSMAARMGRVREVPPTVAGTDHAAAWLEGYDAEDAKGPL